MPNKDGNQLTRGRTIHSGGVWGAGEERPQIHLRTGRVSKGSETSVTPKKFCAWRAGVSGKDGC